AGGRPRASPPSRCASCWRRVSRDWSRSSSCWAAGLAFTWCSSWGTEWKWSSLHDLEVPGVGAELADPHVELGVRGTQLGGGGVEPEPLARPVRHVDEGGPAAQQGLLAGLGCRVMAQVGRDVYVGGAHRRVGEERVAGAAAQRNGLDRVVVAARGADARRGGRQHRAEEPGQGAE